MASKYDPLNGYLSHQRSDRVDLSLDVIGRLVGGLPMSALRHRAWWGNEINGRHVQAASWMAAGWAVESVDLAQRRVVFKRQSAR